MKNKTALLLTHVRHDRETCLTPGLFSTFKRNVERPKLNVTYAHGDRAVQFLGPDRLGGDDLRILQFLQARAAPYDRRGSFAEDPKSLVGQRLAKALDCHGAPASQRKAVIHTTFREIALETGVKWGGGKTAKATLTSLKRMAAITVFLRVGDVEEAPDNSRMLAFFANHATGKIDVALSPGLAAAALGQTRQYVRIEMSEVRALKTDAARIIHQRLCAWVNPGAKKHVTVETLAGYLYPDPAPKLTASAHAKRIARVLHAMDEIAALGWRVTEAGGSTLAVERPVCGRKQDQQRELTGPGVGENRTEPSAGSQAQCGFPGSAGRVSKIFQENLLGAALKPAVAGSDGRTDVARKGKSLGGGAGGPA
jgi:hypothetical protein